MSNLHITKFLQKNVIETGHKKYRLILNSKYLNSSDAMKWKVVRNKSSMSQDTVFIPDFIKEIKGIKIENFLLSIPNLATYITRDAIVTPLRYLNTQILIEEFKAQSFINTETKTNFHFIMTINDKSWYNDIIYKFNNPIQLQENITLQLLDNLQYTSFYFNLFYFGQIDFNRYPDNLLYIIIPFSFDFDLVGSSLNYENKNLTEQQNQMVNNFIFDEENYEILVVGAIKYIKTNIDFNEFVDIHLSQITILFNKDKYKINYNIPLTLYY